MNESRSVNNDNTNDEATSASCEEKGQQHEISSDDEGKGESEGEGEGEGGANGAGGGHGHGDGDGNTNTQPRSHPSASSLHPKTKTKPKPKPKPSSAPPSAPEMSLNTTRTTRTKTFTSLLNMTHPLFHGLMNHLPPQPTNPSPHPHHPPPQLQKRIDKTRSLFPNDVLGIIVESIDDVCTGTSRCTRKLTRMRNGRRYGGDTPPFSSSSSSLFSSSSSISSILIDPIVRIHICDETTGRYNNNNISSSSSIADSVSAVGRRTHDKNMTRRRRRRSIRIRGGGGRGGHENLFVGPMAYTHTCHNYIYTNSRRHDDDDDDCENPVRRRDDNDDVGEGDDGNDGDDGDDGGDDGGDEGDEGSSSSSRSSQLLFQWNEEIIMTETKYSRLFNGKTILLFEVLDRDIHNMSSSSSTSCITLSHNDHANYHSSGDCKEEEEEEEVLLGRKCIAWAYLRPIGRSTKTNHVVNVNDDDDYDDRHYDGDGNCDVHVNIGMRNSEPKPSDDEPETETETEVKTNTRLSERKKCKLQLFQCQHDSWFVRRQARRLLGNTSLTSSSSSSSSSAAAAAAAAAARVNSVPQVYLQYLRQKRVPYQNASLCIRVGPMNNPIISRPQRPSYTSSSHEHTTRSGTDEHSSIRYPRTSTSSEKDDDVTKMIATCSSSNDSDKVGSGSSSGPSRRNIVNRFARKPHEDCELPDTLFLRLYQHQQGCDGGTCSSSNHNDDNHHNDGAIITFNHAGDLLAVASSSILKYTARTGGNHYHQLYVYNINSGDICFKSSRCHHDKIVSVSWSPDDRYIACAGLDSMISVYSMEDESSEYDYYENDNEEMMDGAADTHATISNHQRRLRRWKCLDFILMDSIPTSLIFWPLAKTYEQPLLIVGCSDGSVSSSSSLIVAGNTNLSERGNFDPLFQLLGGKQYHLGVVNAMTSDYSNGRLYTGDEKGCIIIWEPSKKKKGTERQFHSGNVKSMNFEVLMQLNGFREIGGRPIQHLSINHHLSQNNDEVCCRGKKLLITLGGGRGERQTLLQYDFSVHQLSSFCICSESKKACFSLARYSPDTKYVFGCTADGRICFLDSLGIKKKTLHESTRLRLGQQVASVAWSPTAHMLAISYSKEYPILVYIPQIMEK